MKTQVVFILSLLVLTTTTMAQSSPQDLIKFRQSAMMFMRWNIGLIKTQVVKNPQSYNQQQVSAAANAIAGVANTNIHSLFAPGTEAGTGWKATRVKPDFFEREDDVQRYLVSLQKEANELVQVAKSGDPDAVKPQFNKLFQACRSCHKEFRAKP